VGMGKKQYLNKELGEGTVELMKTVKRAIDPLGLFNPGKVSICLLSSYFRYLVGFELYPGPPSRTKFSKDITS